MVDKLEAKLYRYIWSYLAKLIYGEVQLVTIYSGKQKYI